MSNKQHAASIIQKDLKHNWHPCMQMKVFESHPPLVVQSAQGCWITLDSGQRILDGMSSWWCKALGHRHPHVVGQINRQLNTFDHVIFANTTHEQIVRLSERLADFWPQCPRVSYASDGSSAVEMAVKMAIAHHQLHGRHQRQKIAYLSGAYHGETALTMALSDCQLYKTHYSPLLPDVGHRIEIPCYLTVDKPLDDQTIDVMWKQTQTQLDTIADRLAGVLFEPLIQGAGGMRIYDHRWLAKLSAWAKSQGILCIADEIMTGFGRSGSMFACQIPCIVPDLICLGKGLTSGHLPLSAVMTSESIFQTFYADPKDNRAFLHSHTHTGNALAIAAANGTLDAFEDQGIMMRLPERIHRFVEQLTSAIEPFDHIGNLRHLGMVFACDIQLPDGAQLAQAVCRQALKYGLLLRPLGQSLYWLPPLIISNEEIDHMAQASCQALSSVLSVEHV